MPQMRTIRGRRRPCDGTRGVRRSPLCQSGRSRSTRWLVQEPRSKKADSYVFSPKIPRQIRMNLSPNVPSRSGRCRVRGCQMVRQIIHSWAWMLLLGTWAASGAQSSYALQEISPTYVPERFRGKAVFVVCSTTSTSRCCTIIARFKARRRRYAFSQGTRFGCTGLVAGLLESNSDVRVLRFSVGSKPADKLSSVSTLNTLGSMSDADDASPHRAAGHLGSLSPLSPTSGDEWNLTPVIMRCTATIVAIDVGLVLRREVTISLECRYHATSGFAVFRV